MVATRLVSSSRTLHPRSSAAASAPSAVLCTQDPSRASASDAGCLAPSSVLCTQGLVCKPPFRFGTGRDRVELRDTFCMRVEVPTGLGSDSEMIHCGGYSMNDVCRCYESWSHGGDRGYEIS